MIYETEAIVLRRHKITNSDVIVTLFSKTTGKIRAIAKGASRSKSQLAPSSNMFVIANYILKTGKNLHKINSGDLLETYYPIREDMDKLAYCSYFAELTENLIQELQSNEGLYDLLINTYNIIVYSEIQINLKLLKLVFESKSIIHTGIMPELDKCIFCGAELGEKMGISISHGGTFCENCNSHKGRYYLINKRILGFLKYLFKSDPVEILKQDISDELISHTDTIIEDYILTYIGRRNLRSLSFLKGLLI